MAEDKDCDSLRLDLDPLSPSHARDSVNGKCWGGSHQCSGEPTVCLQTDVMSSYDNPESEPREIGQCPSYGKSSLLISEESMDVKNESISQVGSVHVLSWFGGRAM